MRAAMAAAPVGDDVYGEDPSVNALQAAAAALLGFEAALFVPSGVMANQIAIAVHAGRGTEVIAPSEAHIYEYELGMMAAFAGVVPRFVAAPLGVPDPADVEKAIRRSIHQSPTGLIVLENTHNRAGGTIVPLEVIVAIRAIANANGLPFHLDGARLFNAVVASGVAADEIARHFDSVSICLSKGLGAPVGSILLGSQGFMKTAHRYRKMLGGGMRQAGILAVAGQMALEQGPARLASDHQRAQMLAEGLVELGYAVNMRAVQTNMVYLRVDNANEFVAKLAETGVLIAPMDHDLVRLVTHFQVSDGDIAVVLERVAQIG
jgi:threonine aldolase